MAQVIYVPDIPGQQRVFRSWNGPVGRHIRVTTLKANALASLEAPAPGRTPRNRTGINYATGGLAFGGIVPSFGRHGKELEGRVVALPKHALFLHEGTRPHVIVPRTSGMLKFHWRKIGKVVHAKKVMHPGTAANDFLVRGLKKAVRS
jgi:hypothetical protein